MLGLGKHIHINKKQLWHSMEHRSCTSSAQTLWIINWKKHSCFSQAHASYERMAKHVGENVNLDVHFVCFFEKINVIF